MNHASLKCQKITFVNVCVYALAMVMSCIAFSTNAQTGLPVFNVRTYGAQANCPTDDTAAINSAVTAAAGGGIVFFPTGTYCVTNLAIIANNNITIQGAGQQAAVIKTTSTTGDVLSISGSNGQVKNIGFDSSVTRTSGAFLKLSGNQIIVSNFFMNKPYIGVLIIGSINRVENGLIQNATSNSTSAGSGGIQVNANTGDNYISHITTRMDSYSTSTYPTFGINYISGYELNVVESDILQAVWGLLVTPSTGQQAIATSVVNTFFDNVISGGVHVQPSGSGSAQELEFTSTWAGPIGGNGFSFVQTGSTIINGIHIVNCRSYNYTNRSGSGVYIQGTVGDTLVEGSTFGYTGKSFIAGLNVAAGVSDFSFIGNSAMGNLTGINVAPGTSNNYIIQFNRVTGSTTGVYDGGTGANKSVGGNL